MGFMPVKLGFICRTTFTVPADFRPDSDRKPAKAAEIH